MQRVKKLVPKDLVYSRNESEKTAQELFTENHKDMAKDAKSQLVEMGKTCSSLVCELTIFPAVYCFVLVYRGSIGLATFLQYIWHLISSIRPRISNSG